MKRLEFKKEMVKPIAQTKYLNLYDIQYEQNKHYYNASRRKEDNIVLLKSREEIEKMSPDGVGCVVIVRGEEPKLLLNHEFRIPTGQFLLSVPAGLVEENEDFKEAAIREIKEETGLSVDEVRVVCPLMFSSPGMSDETNGMVVGLVDNIDAFDQSNCESSEIFEGYSLLTRQQVKELITKPCDEDGNFYPVYSVVAMLYFLTDLWK